MDGSISHENRYTIYDNRNDNTGESTQAGAEHDTVTRYVVNNLRAYVCASSHLQQGPERQSLLAQEKLGAEMSSHTVAETEMDFVDALSRDTRGQHIMQRG